MGLGLTVRQKEMSRKRLQYEIRGLKIDKMCSQLTSSAYFHNPYLPVVENFRRQAGAKRIKIEPASVYPIEKGYLLKLVVVKNAELVGWD